MLNRKVEDADKQLRAVTYLGLLVNIGLSIIKTAVGLMVGSIALVADGIHSISDMATDVAVLLGAHFGSKEPDPEHPYGHGRLETFSAAFVALVLIVVGCGMIYKAATDIVRMHAGIASNVVIGPVAFWAAGLSVVLKEALYQITKKVAVKLHSSALYANAWHHRSDAASSVAVLAGLIALRFGYEHGDQIAAVAVGLMIIFVAVKIIAGCLGEFAERAVDSDTVENIEKIIEGEKRIRNWHKLRTRSAGREIFIDLHILVDPMLNITEAHEISESLEKAIHENIPRPVNVTVHIEPDNSPQR